MIVNYGVEFSSIGVSVNGDEDSLVQCNLTTVCSSLESQSNFTTNGSTSHFVWYDLPDGNYVVNCSSDDQYSNSIYNISSHVSYWNQVISINRPNETQMVVSDISITNFPLIGCSPLLSCDLNQILSSIQLMESQDHFFCLLPRLSLTIEVQLNGSSSFELEGFSSSLSSHLNVGSTSILFQGSSSSSLMVDSSWIGLNGVEMRFDKVDIRFTSQILNDFISVSSGSLQISNSQLFLQLPILLSFQWILFSIFRLLEVL